ncbi:MAG TPA: hypothetical protein VN778_04435, partial [Verrucomicrobiae bacterium]|nr:hypothetical protein [Verrucomicrobiae bacterium]
MPLNHVETFQQSLVPKDQEEALIINTIYDQLAERGIARATRLQQAIASADESLASTLPSGEQFGFDTINKAFRWWHFRKAYLQDLEPIYQDMDESGDPQQHGLDPRYLSYMDKLAKYNEDQDFSGSRILSGDPLYINTYADTEKERLRREMTDEELFDPFELEYDYVLRTLRKTLDAIMDSAAATGPPHERQYLTVGTGQPEYYSVIRYIEADEVKYIIGLFNDEPEHTLIPAQPSESIPVETFILSYCKAR